MAGHKIAFVCQAVHQESLGYVFQITTEKTEDLYTGSDQGRFQGVGYRAAQEHVYPQAGHVVGASKRIPIAGQADIFMAEFAAAFDIDQQKIFGDVKYRSNPTMPMGNRDLHDDWVEQASCQ